MRANEAYIIAAPVSFCKIDSIAGLNAIAAAISLALGLLKSVSGDERYLAIAREVKILHNSTG